MTREQAERATILRCVVGSTAHGLGVSDALDDRDEMGIVLESLQDTVGFQPFEQFIYRSAAEREGTQDARSRAGDLDLVLYSLRKFCRLALQGNPTVLMLLFAPPLQANAIGHQLQERAAQFISQEAGRRFLGYLTAQKQRLLGERGQKDVNRPELVAQFGYDTKYAMHMLRLGMQGVELLATGRLSLPMQEPERSYLLGVRTGKEDLQAVLTRSGELERELKDAVNTTDWPPRADYVGIEAWMCERYLEHWKSSEVSQGWLPSVFGRQQDPNTEGGGGHAVTTDEQKNDERAAASREMNVLRTGYAHGRHEAEEDGSTRLKALRTALELAQQANQDETLAEVPRRAALSAIFDAALAEEPA